MHRQPPRAIHRIFVACPRATPPWKLAAPLGPARMIIFLVADAAVIRQKSLSYMASARHGHAALCHRQRPASPSLQQQAAGPSVVREKLCRPIQREGHTGFLKNRNRSKR